MADADDASTLLSASPCVGICRLGDDDRCVGCRRTRAELGAWATLTPEQRDAINRRNLPGADPAVRAKLLGGAGCAAEATAGTIASAGPLPAVDSPGPAS